MPFDIAAHATIDTPNISLWADVDTGGTCYHAPSTTRWLCIARRIPSMCKRRTSETYATPTRDGYTGETRRLDLHAPMGSALRFAAGRGGVPWWTLWLLWPLFGVLKAAVPVVWSGIAALSQVTVPLLPLIVVVGVLLVLWRR